MDNLVHCMLDATSKPMKREDSATLAIVLAPNRLPLVYCVTLWNICSPPSGLLKNSGTMQRSGSSSVWLVRESI
jgi:hypothetical protein